MNKRELTQYHSELTGILNSEPDRSKWKEFLSYERTTDQYKFAKEQARLRNLIKPISPVAVGDLPNEKRTEELVDRLIIIIWSKEVLNQYNDLPKANSQERKRVNNLVTQTAGRLLENPQNINIAEKVWTTNGTEQYGLQETQEPFSELVRKECASLIKDKWEDVKPKQIAKLISIYANDNDPSQDFAKDLLKNYFKGPKSRSGRIHAYYNFVSGVLDLAEDDEAFLEGMKIALHATEDILPKNSSLVEQTGLLSLPYGEAESVFKELLIARSVVSQVRFFGSWGLEKYYEDRGNFIISDSVSIEEGNKRRENVIKKIGRAEAKDFSDVMTSFFRTLSAPLSEEGKQALMDTWPFNIAFDKTDPLNQKFQKVFSQNNELLSALKNN